MNNQKLFDTVVNFLVKQGQPSSERTGGFSCKYRGPYGTKCAAGCVMPDNIYDYTFEGKTVSNNVLDKAFKKIGFSTKNLELLGALQSAHDGPLLDLPYGAVLDTEAWMHEFLQRAGAVAKGYSLDATAVWLAEATLHEDSGHLDD